MGRACKGPRRQRARVASARTRGDGERLHAFPRRRDRLQRRYRRRAGAREYLLRAVRAQREDLVGPDLLVARGNIYFEQFERNEKIWADHVEYNTKTEEGKFYDVRGTSAPRIDTRPGMLTSLNPYYFQGKWAERVNGHYILYDGFLTNCRIPNP